MPPSQVTHALVRDPRDFHGTDTGPDPMMKALWQATVASVPKGPHQCKPLLDDAQVLLDQLTHRLSDDLPADLSQKITPKDSRRLLVIGNLAHEIDNLATHGDVENSAETLATLAQAARYLSHAERDLNPGHRSGAVNPKSPLGDARYATKWVASAQTQIKTCSILDPGTFHGEPTGGI